MIIIPAIDIIQGRVVRLHQGDFSKEKFYSDDPVETALTWQKKGATLLHIVDLDGARDGKRINQPVVERILKNVSIPVQLGGGIRDTEGVRTFLDLGVSQVIIGTAALRNKPWIREMLDEYGDRIVVSIDAIGGLVATDGWENVSDTRALDYIGELESYGLRRIVYTDIERDGMLGGPNFKMYGDLQQAVSLQIIASGGITTMEDVRRLKSMGLYGAIIGKALYNGNLDLEEVLKC